MPNKYDVFYSWQSDDNKTRRHIERCLSGAVKQVERKVTLDVRPEIDESTKGRPGAVDIPATIMRKIDKCNLFVADLSFIGEYNGRMIVNQNVLYELGYAMSKHGDNVIMLFNEDKGKIKDLPFDISHRKVAAFSINRDENGKRLTALLTEIILAHIQNPEVLTMETDGVKLDSEEMEILKFFRTMGPEKHIIFAKELDGLRIYPMDGVYDKALLGRMIEQGMQKLNANLDSLVDKKILEKTPSLNHNATHYKLKKLGYNMIEKI